MNTSKTYFRIANIVYPVLKLTGLWLLANLLPLAIMLLLDQDFSNLWLFIVSVKFFPVVSRISHPCSISCSIVPSASWPEHCRQGSRDARQRVLSVAL